MRDQNSSVSVEAAAPQEKRVFRHVQVGEIYGRLTVIAEQPKQKAYRLFLCRCECGTEKVIPGYALTRTAEPYRSCGCLMKDINRQKLTKHGMAIDPHYKVWSAMIARCTNPGHKLYQRYGGRAITVCPDWRDSFECFFRDMGPRPSKKHKLTMRNASLGYNRENCFWSLHTIAERKADQNSETMIGGRFGRWLVVDMAQSDGHGRRCVVQCDCGTVKTIRKHSLTGRVSASRSCGCLTVDLTRERSTKHGGVNLPEYSSWKAMKVRCLDKNDPIFPYYGGRGITIYEPWQKSFQEFYQYLGSRPSPSHTLDRFPNQNGNYEPGNVRWATPAQQNRNLRSNVFITARGKTLCMMDWSLETGIPFTTLRNRLCSGWPIEDALSRPPRPGVTFKPKRNKRDLLESSRQTDNTDIEIDRTGG